MAGRLTPAKARTILRHGSVGGKRLKPKQKRLFGFIAGGGTPKKGRQRQRRDAPVRRKTTRTRRSR